MTDCHDCSCHINPPCGACENCKHADVTDCPQDCQDCGVDHEEPLLHRVTSTDEQVFLNGLMYPGTVARCVCGWKSSWSIRDGSAEADGSQHVRRMIREKNPPAPKPLSPYDSGAVLEPRPWHVQPKNLPSPEETERYGRVDFDDDEGQTLFTVRAVRVANGYSLEITSLDPDTNLIPRIIEKEISND